MTVDPVAAVEISKTLLRSREAFGGDGGKDSLFRHDEAVALIEKVIVPKFRGSEIDGNEVCAGAKSAAVATARFREIQGADRGDDPIGTHEAHGGHAIEGQINVSRGRGGEGSFVAGNKGTDAAAAERQIIGQL